MRVPQHSSRKTAKNTESRDLWNESFPVEFCEYGSQRQIRIVINSLTCLLIVVMAIVSSSLWLGQVRHTLLQIFPPQVYSGSLLYGTVGSRLEGIRSSDGGLQWTFQDIADKTAKYENGDIIFALNGELSELEAIRDRDGHRLWSQGLGETTANFLLGADASSVYINSSSFASSNTIKSFNAQSGKLQWSYQYQVNTQIDFQFADHDIFTCQSNDHLLTMTVIDTQAGMVRWQREVPLPPMLSVSKCALLGDIASVQFIKDVNHFTHPQTQTTIVAYDHLSGSYLWQNTFVGSIVGQDDSTLYISTWADQGGGSRSNNTEDDFEAFNISNGVMQWQLSGKFYPLHDSSLLTNTIWHPIVIAGNLVALTENGLVGIDKVAGTVRWHVTYILPAAVKIISTAESNALYFSDAYSFYAINGATGQREWQILNLRLGEPLALMADHTCVFFSAANELYAIDKNTGKSLWNKIVSFYSISLS